MKAGRQNIMYVRNPIYVFYTLGAVLLLLLSAALASRPNVGPVEHGVFNALYFLPKFVTPIAFGISLVGSIVVSALVVVFQVVRRRQDIAWRLAIAAGMAYGLAILINNWINRGSPSNYLGYAVPKTELAGLGYPATVAAVSIATATTLSLYAPRAYRRWINGLTLLVGAALICLGLQLPIDVITGWAVGITCFSLTSLVFGSVHRRIDAQRLAARLRSSGLADAQLKPASVDARGSVPFFGSYKGGEMFVKVFNQDNNAADWLFKVIRRIQYRRLEDEVPSLTPKRAIEHEAYLTMLATHIAGVRVPEVLGIYKVGNNSYAMAANRLDATGLDQLDKNQITDEMLDGIWRQIKKLHQHNIIHKDLRCANVMIEKSTKLPWMIDFGFSECAVSPKSFYRDNVEFIASSATKVGAKRAVAAAARTLGQPDITRAIPYMQYAALSGATTTALKAKPQLIHDIRQEMYAVAELEPGKVKQAKIGRISSGRKLK